MRLTLVFLILAMIAAIFGFGNVLSYGEGAVRIAFCVFIALFILSLFRNSYDRW